MRRRRRMAARWYQGCSPGSIRFHQQQSQRRSSLTYLLMEFLLSLHQRRTWPSNKSQKCTNSVFIFQQCLIFDFIFIGNTFMGHYKYLYVYITMIEGLKVERPLSRKSNIEVKPVISDGHLKFCTTTCNLWMATVKQRSYQQLS